MVTAIIIVLIAIVTPAFGPILQSARFSSTTDTLSGLTTSAQALAQKHMTNVALRIEAVFDANGIALGYQRASFWMLAGGPHNTDRFVPVPDTQQVDLPSEVWLAPDYCLDNVVFYPTTLEMRNFLEDTRLGTFHIVFDADGQIVRFGEIWYQDPASGQRVRHPLPTDWNPTPGPQPSAFGVIVYDRGGYELRREVELQEAGAQKQGPLLGDDCRDFIRDNGQVRYISRFVGTIIEGRPR